MRGKNYSTELNLLLPPSNFIPYPLMYKIEDSVSNQLSHSYGASQSKASADCITDSKGSSATSYTPANCFH